MNFNCQTKIKNNQGQPRFHIAHHLEFSFSQFYFWNQMNVLTLISEVSQDQELTVAAILHSGKLQFMHRIPKYTFRDTYILLGIQEYLHTFRDLGILECLQGFRHTCILQGYQNTFFKNSLIIRYCLGIFNLL